MPAAIIPNTHNCDLLFEAYGAPGCNFCNSLLDYNTPNQRSIFAQEAVFAYGTLLKIKSLIPLDCVEGGLVDPADNTRQTRFHITRRPPFECTLAFRGLWLLGEQLDVLKAMHEGFTAHCSHSIRARMRIERQ